MAFGKQKVFAPKVNRNTPLPIQKATSPFKGHLPLLACRSGATPGPKPLLVLVGEEARGSHLGKTSTGPGHPVDDSEAEMLEHLGDMQAPRKSGKKKPKTVLEFRRREGCGEEGVILEHTQLRGTSSQ
jgi:hypothetical protein